MDVGAYFPHRVTYHATCHSLRVLHVGDMPYAPATRSERHRPGGLATMLEECCGFGGTFAIKNADTSTAMLGDKIAQRARHRQQKCSAPPTPPA